ncbi:hypothetical protein [Thiobacillus sp.]|uniref:hypothetical protein n=1 Tax=Thiobacillus sp. TaxID=924 RepID=UPI00286E746D|nr:hypothetical protein [Thiobacillus sp.]
MKINSKSLTTIIEPALDDFFKHELTSILADVSERSLCSRLALHFETHMKANGLTGYYADTEYNRKQEGEVKTILSGNMEEIQITCDMIVHSRGEIPKKDNLIALEMAKSNKSSSDMQDDRNRLMALTKTSFNGVWSNDGKTFPEHVCGYSKGLYLIINHHKRTAELESYYRGKQSKATVSLSF